MDQWDFQHRGPMTCGFTVHHMAWWCMPHSRVSTETCLMSWPTAHPQGGPVSWCCAAPMDGTCASVCCSTLLSNGLVGSACGQARCLSSDREAGRVRLMQRKWGREYWVTMYLNYLYGLVWSQCFFRRLIQTCMVTGSQPLRTPRAVGPGWT